MSEELIKKIDLKIKDELSKIDDLERVNSEKVLNAFIKEQVAETDFNATTGYGYNDVGRDKIEKIYSDIFKSEDALVRNQFISGSHALTVAFFALLRPGDTLLSITGKPYDTMDEVIGLVDNPSSLKSFGINYMQVDLVNNDFDYDKIKEVITTNKIKVIEIQRSKGYSTRCSLTIDKVESVISFIKSLDKDIIIMVDNCYCEFVSTKEPIEVGADIAVGSLIKNLGGGIAPNGAYIVGRSDFINACAERLTLPGEGREVGPSLGINKQLLQGLFLAPSVVSSSLKTAIFTMFVSRVRYSVKDIGWENEQERRYIIELKDEAEFIDAVIEDGYFKVESSLFQHPDYLLSCSDAFRNRFEANAISHILNDITVPCSLCNDCLSISFHRGDTKCRECGKSNLRHFEGRIPL